MKKLTRNMKITIWGSMMFAKDMYEANKSLVNRGHEVFLSESFWILD